MTDFGSLIILSLRIDTFSRISFEVKCFQLGTWYLELAFSIKFLLFWYLLSTTDNCSKCPATNNTRESVIVVCLWSFVGYFWPERCLSVI